jgi:hypothetical protein
MRIKIEEFGDGKVTRPWLVLKPESPAEEIDTATLYHDLEEGHAVTTRRVGLVDLAVRLHRSGRIEWHGGKD